MQVQKKPTINFLPNRNELPFGQVSVDTEYFKARDYCDKPAAKDVAITHVPDIEISLEPQDRKAEFVTCDRKGKEFIASFKNGRLSVDIESSTITIEKGEKKCTWNIPKIESEFDISESENSCELDDFMRIQDTSCYDDSFPAIFYFSSFCPCPVAVQFLLSFPNLNVNKAYHSQTALMHASVTGNKEIVSLLLDHPKIDLTCRNNGKTALDMAIEKGHVEIVQLLQGYAK